MNGLSASDKLTYLPLSLTLVLLILNLYFIYFLNILLYNGYGKSIDGATPSFHLGGGSND